MPKKRVISEVVSLSAPLSIVPCAHEGCAAPAMANVRVARHAHSKLCQRHYEEHHQAIADETCARLGLPTVEQKRRWLRENAGRVLKRFLVPDQELPAPPQEPREPGEDQ